MVLPVLVKYLTLFFYFNDVAKIENISGSTSAGPEIRRNIYLT
jgi:hypothetical protein